MSTLKLPSLVAIKGFYITKASSGRAKLEFLFTKIGVGSKLIWPRDRIDISKERALHPPPPKRLIESI